MIHPGIGPVNALAFVLAIGADLAIPLQQADRQLPGIEPQRIFLWRQAAVGRSGADRAGWRHGPDRTDPTGRPAGVLA
jgi:hypothetical protein